MKALGFLVLLVLVCFPAPAGAQEECLYQYMVEAGDTCFSVAKKMGLGPHVVCEASVNGGSATFQWQIGDVVSIPVACEWLPPKEEGPTGAPVASATPLPDPTPRAGDAPKGGGTGLCLLVPLALLLFGIGFAWLISADRITAGQNRASSPPNAGGGHRRKRF